MCDDGRRTDRTRTVRKVLLTVFNCQKTRFVTTERPAVSPPVHFIETNLGGPSLVFAIFAASDRVIRPSSFKSPGVTTKFAPLASEREMWPSLFVSAFAGVLGIFTVTDLSWRGTRRAC